MIKLIDRSLNFIALTAAAMLLIPISILLLGTAFPNAYTILPAVTLVSVYFGYFVQSVNAKLMRKTASGDGFDDKKKGVIEGFKLYYAALSFLILGIIAFFLTLLFDYEMNILVEAKIISYHSEVYSVLFANFLVFSSFSGTVMWFYPSTRFFSAYILLGGASVFLIETIMFMIVKGQYEENFSGAFIGVPFAVFIVCVLVIYNQSNLSKKYRGSVVSVITPSARMYNLFLVFVLLAVFAAACGVFYIVYSGLYLIFKFLFLVILYKVFGYGKPSDSDMYDYYSEYEAGAQIAEKLGKTNSEAAMIISLFLFFSAIIIAVAIGIKTGAIVRLYKRIKSWLKELITEYIIGREIFKNAYGIEEDENINYKDEKKSIQRAQIRDYEELACSTDSYKAFLVRLGKLPDFDSQLCYAYSVLLRMYQKSITLKSSDTPREVEDKVIRKTSGDRIRKITEDFEKIRYAEIEMETSEAAAALGNICEEIKKYLY